ncbi:MAG: hypothetical protein GX488_02180 [Clostridiales bacterium]|nr:hypothetical protein [Clostridiales bacterium]
MKKFIPLVSLLLIIILVLPVFSAPACAASAADFSDVKSTDWFYDSVNFTAQKGMFTGTSSGVFSPNGTMTRGMFVTVLGRYCKVPATSAGYSLGIITKSDVNMRSAPSSKNTSVITCLQINTRLEVSGTFEDLYDSSYTWYAVKYKGMSGYVRSDLLTVIDSGFSDVPSSAYYSSYVRWAFSYGIASDTGIGVFSPERNITREEICTMLYNLAGYKNVQLNPVLTPVVFSDIPSSSESAEKISVMQRAGIITGYGDGTFRPQASATRAEVSAMLMRFINAISYKPANEPSYDSYGNYIFGTEVPQKSFAGSDYFSDACFIGHSLVNGMKSYFGLSNADFFAKNGASAKYFLSYADFELESVRTDETGSTVHNTGTLEQALSEKSYGKVYIMLGVNEIGSQPSQRQAFYSNMSSVIDLVKKIQPDAKIYLISLSPVSQKCSESRKDVNRDNIIAYNNILKQLCRDKSAYYLNIFDLLCDSDGFLPENSCMSDGIHLLSTEYAKIKSYIFTHTI